MNSPQSRDLKLFPCSIPISLTITRSKTTYSGSETHILKSLLLCCYVTELKLNEHFQKISEDIFEASAGVWKGECPVLIPSMHQYRGHHLLHEDRKLGW